jgi:hypothetical protein
MGLALFRWVTPPLQPRVVGPYPIRDVWFPSRLSLEETDRIQKNLAVIDDPRYPRYFTLTSLLPIDTRDTSFSVMNTKTIFLTYM